ncbi:MULTISPECIES: LacI family DNA-binding transcriptional regulator [unclassified Aureimonas]|uniref:LacI family DNA-binding transcriptional regulator n=1 Tax=unclassified Aureimonas TaxID=2615206 RepID=UPI0006F6768E|nr:MULTISPECIES: LacI family DNA-binding transcriptional regulator [unclassified Aureimonas]KQT53832.1 LacI family transcriptional regulator [Aureimonas sp. Leaf427]KQT71727.1 LacI family transcriptional regulator [Aureimonas sp. Leaf460]
MRATLIDVAREAGVSPATVDRVLNNRSGVRTRTRQIVLETAQRLGYIGEEGGTGPAVAHRPGERIDLHFALPAGTNPFMQTLQAELLGQGKARDGIAVHVETIEGFDPDALARMLQGLQGKTQGVGVIALDHPTVREAIRSLSSSGVKVVTIASDILHVPRVAYVGIDNRAAGRLAGYLVKRFVGPGRTKIALFAGSLSYRGHEEREMGFRHFLNEEATGLHIVEMREMLDDREKAYEEASALLDRHPDLAAIYNVGAGNTGIAKALKEHGFQKDVTFIGHDLTAAARALLLDGTLDAIIDQNPRVEAREALNILTHAISDVPYEGHPPRLQVIFKENIPEH